MSDRNRDRSPRGGGSRFGNRRSNGPPSSRRAPVERRVFVSNIPFEMKWQEVKDMFREHVGDVTFVELFCDENEKSRGCGILEFASQDMAKKAVDKMHRYDLKGRKLVVKEDFDTERDKHGKIIKGTGGRDRDRGRDRDDHRDMGMGRGNAGGGDWNETYGLSPEFLDSLGIDSPLHTRLFVANLSYSVDEKKLREVFRLAGRVVSAELNRDKDNKSRGHGVIEYSHPVEAVQAISMLNNQMLFDRKMTVRFDKQPGPTPEELDQLPSRLPEGLGAVGYGLGEGGRPLTNVALNLAQQNNRTTGVVGMGVGGANSGVNVPNVAELASSINVIARQMGMNMNNQGGGGGGMGNTGPGNTNMPLISNLMGGGNNGMMGGGGNMPPSNSSMGASMGSSMGASMGASMGDMSGRTGPVISNQSDTGGGYNNSNSAPGGSSGGNQTGGYNTNRMMDSNTMQRSVPGGVGVGGGAPPAQVSDAVVVRNLPLETTWQNLREVFSQCGEIKYAEMKDRGIGLIRFASERDADRAVTLMHNQMFKGGVLDVRLF